MPVRRGLGGAIAVAMLSALVGCEPGTCSARTCACGGADPCEAWCGVDCAYTCESPTCYGGCGDRCTARCDDRTNCELDCENDCSVACTRTDRCLLSCFENCDVTCTDVVTCDVTMSSGVLRCAGVGACELSCWDPARGGTTASTDCGAGVHACGPCPG